MERQAQEEHGLAVFSYIMPSSSKLETRIQTFECSNTKMCWVIQKPVSVSRAALILSRSELNWFPEGYHGFDRKQHMSHCTTPSCKGQMLKTQGQTQKICPGTLRNSVDSMSTCPLLVQLWTIALFPVIRFWYLVYLLRGANCFLDEWWSILVNQLLGEATVPTVKGKHLWKTSAITQVSSLWHHYS